MRGWCMSLCKLLCLFLTRICLLSRLTSYSYEWKCHSYLPSLLTYTEISSLLGSCWWPPWKKIGRGERWSWKESGRKRIYIRTSVHPWKGDVSLSKTHSTMIHAYIYIYIWYSASPSTNVEICRLLLLKYLGFGAKYYLCEFPWIH